MKAIKNILLCVLSLSVALLLAETAFRLIPVSEIPTDKQYINFLQSLTKQTHPFYPDHDSDSTTYNYYTYRPGSCWATQYPDNPRGYFNKNNQILYRINSDGFRDYPFPEKAPEGCSIVAIGDSQTLGEGVRLKDTYVKRLEEMLKSDHPDCRVYNLGINGHGIRDELVTLAKTIKRFHPDLIIWGYSLNDISHAKFDRWILKMHKQKKRWLNVHTPFRIVNYIKHRLWQWYMSKAYVNFVQNIYEQPNYWNSLTTLLEKIKTIIHDSGGKMLVVIFPNLDALQQDSYPFRPIHKTLSDFFNQKSIPFIDLSPQFKARDPQNLKVHEVDRHPNEIGHAIAAKTIMAYLQTHPEMLETWRPSGSPSPQSE